MHHARTVDDGDMSHAPQVAAGWYQDPHDASHWRWWDGIQWTENTAPMQPAQQAVQVALVPTTVAPHVVSPVATATTTATTTTTDDPWAQPRYIVCQKIVALGSRYEMLLPSLATAGSDKPADGQLVGLVQRKKLALRERIWFRDAQERELFELVAPKVFNLTSKYELRTPDGATFAVLKKNVGLSFWRTSWKVLDGTGTREMATAQESSGVLAFCRRLGDFVPYLGIANLFPYQFTIRAGSGAPNAGAEIGSYRRRHGVRDRYDLDLRGDAGVTLDRRAALGLAIALDVLQNR